MPSQDGTTRRTRSQPEGTVVTLKYAALSFPLTIVVIVSWNSRCGTFGSSMPGKFRLACSRGAAMITASYGPASVPSCEA